MTDAAAPEPVQPAYRVLQVGDPVPWFKQNSTSNPNFSFDTVAGRYIVLCFYGMGSDEVGRATLASFQDQHRSLFDDDKIALFGVSVDPSDQSEGRARQIVPGIRHFWDFDGTVGRLYGALPRNVQPGQGPVPIRRFWMVLNSSLRVRAIFPFEENGSDREKVMAYLRDLPPVSHYAGFELPAPVLVIPDVFEPEFCRHLIGLYEQHGGEESGFMREVDGKTVAAHDPNHKRRKDYTIEDPNLIRQVQHRIIRRINPEIERVHFFKPSRMERYIVSCYAAEDGAIFAPTGTTPPRARPTAASRSRSTSTMISRAAR